MTLALGSRVAALRQFEAFARYKSRWLHGALMALYDDPEVADRATVAGLRTAAIRWRRWAARTYPEARALVHACRWTRRHLRQRPTIPATVFLTACAQIPVLELSRTLGRPRTGMLLQARRNRDRIDEVCARWGDRSGGPPPADGIEIAGEVRNRWILHEAMLATGAVGGCFALILAASLVLGGGQLL